MTRCKIGFCFAIAVALLLPGCATRRPPLVTVEPSYSILLDSPALESLVGTENVAFDTPVAQAPPPVWAQ